MADDNSGGEARSDPKAEGSVGAAIGLGFLVQLLCIGLPILVAQFLLRPAGYSGAQLPLLFVAGFFGITQWIVLGPLMWRMKAKKRTVKGLLIVGALGFLLSSACGLFLSSR